MWKNFLPESSRVTEIYSSIGIIILAICMGWPGFDLGQLVVLEPIVTWQVVLLIFGTLQLYSLLHYPKIEFLRIILSWVSGCFWIWVGVSSVTHVSAEDIAAVVLGISNLYGFIINSNTLRIQWK